MLSGFQVCSLPFQCWTKVHSACIQLSASLCNALTNWDTQISIYTGPDCNSLSCVDGADDGCNMPAGQSALTVSAEATRYYIMVHGFEKKVGSFQLDLGCGMHGG